MANTSLPDQPQQRLEQVQHRLRNALAEAGRRADSAQLLAVSKMQPGSAVRALYELGQRAFGENYLQQALEKQQELTDLAISWHFIGPIQSNKTREIAAHFDWVHSLDREKIARRLSEQRPTEMEPLKVCIQVNVSNEESKSGVAVADVVPLANTIATLPGLELRGLMAIPSQQEDPAAQREPFARLRQLLATLQSQLPESPLDTLSMGMSGDLEAAIAEGATMVRIGTALFGPRPSP